MTREERLRRINENMELFGPLPEDYEEFVEHSVFKLDNIIIYSSKENEAYCTGCKQTSHSLKLFNKPLKHNQRAICPCCGRLSMAKSKGLIKNGFEVIRWSLLVQPSDEDVLFRYVNHLRTYMPDGSYTQTSTEMLRTVLTKMSIKDFGNYYDGWAFYRRPMNSWYGRGEAYEPKENIMLYNLDIEEDLKDTICKYSAVNTVAKSNDIPEPLDIMSNDTHSRQGRPYLVEKYLSQYTDKPYLEQLVKLGYTNLLKAAMGEYCRWQDDVFHPGKQRIHETLGLTRSEYLQLKKMVNPTTEEVHILYELRKHGLHVSDEAYRELCNKCGNCIEVSNFAIARRYMSETKAIKMLRENGSRYSDYLDMADKLHWNMKSSMVLFPKDVKEAHDMAVEQFNKQKQKNIRVMLKKVIQSHIYDYSDKDLMIVVPKSGAQIVKEGQVLHHCVARYVDEVGKGNTMILFVRNVENPTKPFYTLEWKDNKIQQCYGLKDCKTTPRVKAFIDGFERYMKKELLSATA